MFTFSDGNITSWLDREELECSYSLDSGEGPTAITFEEAKLNGVGEFCLRLLLIPTSHMGASVFVAAHPTTKQELKDRLGEHASSLLTPHITLQVKEVRPNGGANAGRAAHALFVRQCAPPSRGYREGAGSCTPVAGQRLTRELSRFMSTLFSVVGSPPPK